MNQSPPGEIILQADKEHGGIRSAIPLIMLAAGIAIFWLIDPLLLAPLLGGGNWDGFRPFLRLALSVVLGIAVGGVAETILKHSWGSGRRLRLDSDGLTIEEKGKEPERIDWNERVNVLRWRYLLSGYPRGGRERRVPTGHILLSYRLLQDDCSIVVYCYRSPKKAQETPGYADFVALNMAELYDSTLLKRFSPPERPSISSTLLSGRHGQLWAAEKERWAAGFELEPDDFVTLATAVHAVPPSA